MAVNAAGIATSSLNEILKVLSHFIFGEEVNV